MQDWLIHPVVQGVLFPFLAGLAISAALMRLRLAGLSAVAGFAAAVYLAVGFQFTPLTTIRKIMLLGFVAPAIGVAADLAFKPTRVATPLLAAIAGIASVWVFLAMLGQREAAKAILAGGATVAYVAWMTAAVLSLRGDAVRAGTASLALGLGTGIAAVFAASATLGLYAIAFGTASGGFLLVQMILGRRAFAGMTFTLPVGLLAGLIGCAAVYLAQLPWHTLAVMAAVPLVARMPVPGRWRVWAQAVAVSLPALAVAALGCFLAWQASRGGAG
jgi:hypothetical protein